MPSICVRSVSPRNTLPRAAPRKKPMKKTGNSNVTTPRRGHRNEDVDELATPRASTFDVRNEPDSVQSASMTSSIVCGSRDSSNPSPSETRDVAGEFIHINTPKVHRCLSRSTKAKRIRFYRNGDQYYKGMWYALRGDRVRSMKPLMEDLAKAMGDSQALPMGIRHIFTIDGQTRVTSIDQFEDGESYVCSSSETFKPLDYANAKEPLWCFTLARTSRPHDVSMLGLTINEPVSEPTDFVYPKIITVIRNGVKPRRVVRHLLNKKTARSFDQVMTDLTGIVKLDSGAIRKLFALSGKPVTCLQDFFHEDGVFIAYGNERTSADDFFVISEEYKRLYNGGQRLGVRRGLPSRRSRVMPARNESLREDRCGSVLPDELARHLPVELDDIFTVLKLLGDGNTALVYEVRDKRNNEHSALKLIGRENVVGKEQLIESELEIMSRIQHPYIVQMFNSWHLGGSYYLSLELVDGGDLFEHLCVVRRLSERQASRLTKCLVEALKYLHDQDIVHRDVKPENLLLYTTPNGDLDLKLADFGLATQLKKDDEEKLTVICGTPTYVAAEVLMETGYDEKVDIWATGVILYVMLCGFPPFQSTDGSQEELFTQILRGRLGFPSPAWDHISWSLKALILCLVNIDVDERFSADDILANQWIQSGGEISADYEAMAELAVEARIDVEEELEETEREYFLSRRTSMDELSEGGRRDSTEFHFTRSYS